MLEKLEPEHNQEEDAVTNDDRVAVTESDGVAVTESDGDAAQETASLVEPAVYDLPFFIFVDFPNSIHTWFHSFHNIY